MLQSMDASDTSGSAIERALNLVSAATGELHAASEQARVCVQHTEALELRLRAVQACAPDLAVQLVASQEHVARVMGLYVATYQLHASLDPADVRATIAEIAINLLGAERFVLLLRPAPASACQIAMAEGLDEDTTGLFRRGSYAGGDPMIDAALGDGALRIGPLAGSSLLAVVPLVVQEVIVGALVICKLLRHRDGFAAHDHDLLDLLGAHAASALFAAQVHSTADRKLKTLESLVKLAQRGPTP